MKFKTFAIMLLMGLISVPLSATEHEIELKQTPGHSSGGRSVVIDEITALLDNNSLSFSVTSASNLSVYVYSQSNPWIPVLEQTVMTAEPYTIDISNLIPGNYVLNVYAFGCWWTGTFYIE